MAKLSFEESELSNPETDDLTGFERDTLENWVMKFKYEKGMCVVVMIIFVVLIVIITITGYPIRGRLSIPDISETREFKRQDLSVYKGSVSVGVDVSGVVWC